MTKICLIRHGQTDYNEKGKIQGRMDNVLNETGRKQAKKAALLIKNKKYEFDVFFSSSLLRAYETSKIIKKDLNFPNKIIKSDKFIERDFGELEGTTLSEQTYKELDKETAIGLESFNNLKKGLALPSATGTSGPLTSTVMLSMFSALIAAKTCSTVEIEPIPFMPMVVPLDISMT